VLLEGDEVPVFFRAKLSPHQVSICDVLASLEFEGAAPRELLLIGVEPVSMDLGLEPDAGRGRARAADGRRRASRCWRSDGVAAEPLLH
jgi:Ni,Fe-hydrogenase maturation factor